MIDFELLLSLLFMRLDKDRGAMKRVAEFTQQLKPQCSDSVQVFIFQKQISLNS